MITNKERLMKIDANVEREIRFRAVVICLWWIQV